MHAAINICFELAALKTVLKRLGTSVFVPSSTYSTHVSDNLDIILTTSNVIPNVTRCLTHEYLIRILHMQEQCIDIEGYVTSMRK